MKQKILFALLAAVCLVGCGSEEEEVQGGIETYYSNVSFAGVWNVAEVNIDGRWQSSRTAGYKDSQIVIAEDSCYQSSGRFGFSYGRYTADGSTVNCLDNYRKLHLLCEFKNIVGNKATATIVNKNGISLDYHLERDDSNPALYLDPLKYLNGTWDIDQTDNGYIILRGYSADIHYDGIDDSFWINRQQDNIGSLRFSGNTSNFSGFFDLSKEPYTIHLQGRIYYPNNKYISLKCTKREE